MIASGWLKIPHFNPKKLLFCPKVILPLHNFCLSIIKISCSITAQWSSNCKEYILLKKENWSKVLKCVRYQRPGVRVWHNGEPHDSCSVCETWEMPLKWHMGRFKPSKIKWITWFSPPSIPLPLACQCFLPIIYVAKDLSTLQSWFLWYLEAKEPLAVSQAQDPYRKQKKEF